MCAGTPAGEATSTKTVLCRTGHHGVACEQKSRSDGAAPDEGLLDSGPGPPAAPLGRAAQRKDREGV